MTEHLHSFNIGGISRSILIFFGVVFGLCLAVVGAVFGGLFFGALLLARTIQRKFRGVTRKSSGESTASKRNANIIDGEFVVVKRNTSASH